MGGVPTMFLAGHLAMTPIFPMSPAYRRPLAILVAAWLLFGGAWLWWILSPAPAPAPASAAALLDQSPEQMIQRWQGRLQGNPEDSYAYAQLGLSYLLQVRETADASLYGRADQAFDAALRRDPNQFYAIIGQGLLALSRHDFAKALTWSERGQALNPFSADALGIQVDGQVELGRYDQAVVTAQRMVNLRPDLSSYSRAAYLRELNGDTAGAIVAMKAAVEASVPGSEPMLWTQTQLGHLYRREGDLDAAAAAYRIALHFRANYPFALGGMAALAAAKGDDAAAIATYTELVNRLPLPEFIIPLGELYERAGDKAQAKQQYELVRVVERLQAAAGANVDLELARFDIDHGAEPVTALAAARVAYAERPTLYAADTLAWALYHTGDFVQARRFSDEAMRLGTEDAMLSFHAGMIARALGDTNTARQQLQRTMSINPEFDILQAAPARRALVASDRG